MSRNLSIRDAIAYAINDVSVETPDQAASAALRAVVFALDCYKLRVAQSFDVPVPVMTWACPRCGFRWRHHSGLPVGAIIDVILSHEDGCR